VAHEIMKHEMKKPRCLGRLNLGKGRGFSFALVAAQCTPAPVCAKLVPVVQNFPRKENPARQERTALVVVRSMRESGA
jgi:hypothetical protein